MGQGSRQSDQYWLRLVAVVFMAAAVFHSWRLRRRTAAVPGRGPPAGAVSSSSWWRGICLPSPTYAVGAQVVGTTKMSAAATTVWVIIVKCVLVLSRSVPVLLFLLAPGWTVPKLRSRERLAEPEQTHLLVAVVGAIGLWEFIDSLVGLLS